MIFLLRLILIVALSFVTALFMPWWSALLSSVVIAFVLPGHNFNVFLSGFIGVGMLWLVMAWIVDQETHSILSTKIAVLFSLGGKNMLIIFTGILGAIAGALGAFLGNSLRHILQHKKGKTLYSRGNFLL